MQKADYHYLYNKERYKRVRAKMLALLGNKCVHCGSVEDLEIDHIDANSKSFDVTKCWAYAWSKVELELAKCQLLCSVCHIAKTLTDFGVSDARKEHGTLSSYRYCKCDLCKEAKRIYSREYKRRRSSAG